MQVFGLFWGGPDYAVGSVHNDGDVEVLDGGIAEAVAVLSDRIAGRDRMYPGVSDRFAEWHLWMTDPRAAANDGMAREYPDRRVFTGPRGGIRVERV